MLPSNIFQNGMGQIGAGGVNTQSRDRWQWQPSLTEHDPNPPITLEDVGAGQLFLQAIVGGLSFSGGLIRGIKKLLSGTLVTGGILTRSTLRSLSGTLTFLGLMVRGTSVAEFGILSWIGSLVREISLSPSGSLPLSGGLTHQVGKILSGVLSFTGNLNRDVGKILIGGLSFAGTLVAEFGAQQFQQAVGGLLTFAGFLQRDTFSRGLVGIVSFVGTSLRSTDKRMASVLVFDGTLSTLRILLKSVVGTLSFSGGLVNLPTKSLLGTLSASGGLVKSIRRRLSGLLDFIGSLAAQFQPQAFVPEMEVFSTANLAASPQSSVGFSEKPIGGPIFLASPASSVEFE